MRNPDRSKTTSPSGIHTEPSYRATDTDSDEIRIACPSQDETMEDVNCADG